MMIATRTITVNAAFLQEIKQDNVELRILIQDMSQQLLDRMPRRADFKALVEGLGRLRDQLAIHFALEEAFGYFEDAIDVVPRLSERAEELRAQHDGFFRDMCGLVDQAEQLLYHEKPRRHLRRVAEKFAAFYQALGDHEARERELIMEAFDEDIGVGD